MNKQQLFSILFALYDIGDRIETALFINNNDGPTANYESNDEIQRRVEKAIQLGETHSEIREVKSE